MIHELIRKKAILKNSICNDINCDTCPFGDVSMCKLRTMVVELEPIDAEPVVHGHWDADADGYADGELVYDHWFCSKCEWDDNGCLEEKPSYKYCPNCGAKMDGEHKLSRPKNKAKREVKNGT